MDDPRGSSRHKASQGPWVQTTAQHVTVGVGPSTTDWGVTGVSDSVAGCAGASCWRTLVRVITRSDPDQRLVATLGVVCPVSDHKRTAIAQVSDTRLAREMVPVECAIRLYRRRAM